MLTVGDTTGEGEEQHGQSAAAAHRGAWNCLQGIYIDNNYIQCILSQTESETIYQRVKLIVKTLYFAKVKVKHCHCCS